MIVFFYREAGIDVLGGGMDSLRGQCLFSPIAFLFAYPYVFFNCCCSSSSGDVKVNVGPCSDSVETACGDQSRSWWATFVMHCRGGDTVAGLQALRGWRALCRRGGGGTV